MSLRISKFLFLGLFATTVATAGPLQTPGTKLLICTDRGTFLGSCKLTSIELAPPQSFEAALNVTYKFPCKGPPVEFKVRTQISPDDPKSIADFPFTFTSDSKTLTAVGYGPFQIVDTNTNKTLNRPFDKICDLTIESLEIKASTTTKEKWQDELAALNKLLVSYKDNVNSWGALALLEPAFKVYDSLVNNAAADFSNRSELLLAAQGLLACVDGSDEEDCDTVIGKIIDSKALIGFSDEEGKKLSRLQKALDNADFSGVLVCKEDDEGCVKIDQFLKKYLTTDDIAKMKDAREKMKVVVDAKTKLSDYENLVIETQNSIITLSATIKEFE